MIMLHSAGHAAHLRHHKTTANSLPSTSLAGCSNPIGRAVRMSGGILGSKSPMRVSAMTIEDIADSASDLAGGL
jgi:hypothetical protein